MEDWALIRHLHRSEGLSQRAIARQLSIARDTVASALASDGPPKYERDLGGLGDQLRRATDPGAAVDISADAGDGDRRAGRVDGFDLMVPGAGAGDFARSTCPPIRSTASSIHRDG